MKTQKTSLLTGLLLLTAVLVFTACEPELTKIIRVQVITNDLRVVNFVSTNKVFIADTIHQYPMTAESQVELTNGQPVSGEVEIESYGGPGGRITRMMIYPKNPNPNNARHE